MNPSVVLKHDSSPSLWAPTMRCLRRRCMIFTITFPPAKVRSAPDLSTALKMTAGGKTSQKPHGFYFTAHRRYFTQGNAVYFTINGKLVHILW